jgi:hypothetical protein
MDIELAIIWDTAKIDEFGLWLDADDGRPVRICVPKDELDTASKKALSCEMIQVRGFRGWLETAIRNRYFADPAPFIVDQSKTDSRVMMVCAADFIQH